MRATVAVVGRGFGACVHAPGWELAGARVLGVAGRDGWRALVDAADVVSVATPPAERLEVVEAAAARGAAIMCEKPLASSLADAERLAELSRGLATAVNFSYRALPAFARLGALTGAGELEVTWRTSSRLHRGEPSWKDDPAQGGALSAYGVHAVDYARWLLGDARVERANVAPNEDAFQAELVHERGRSRISVSLVSTERVHRLRIGEFVLENVHMSDPVGAFTLTRAGVTVDVSPLATPAGDPRVAPFAVHARALLDDDDRPTFTDGLHAQQLLDEVRRAAR